jgi:hypothetical protein
MPELGRVGVIAAAGFRSVLRGRGSRGVQLVPSPPKEDAVEATVPSAAPVLAGSAAPAAVSSAAGEAPAPPQRTDAETTKISDMQVTACRDGKGKKKKDCDRIAIDDRVRPHLAALTACQEARGASETLSIGLELSFVEQTITDTFAGSQVPFLDMAANQEALSEKIAGQLKASFTIRSTRCSISFSSFSCTAVAERPAGDETADASGLATVVWDVAVVRDQPEDGKIVTRLRYGTRVAVPARRGRGTGEYDAKAKAGPPQRVGM